MPARENESDVGYQRDGGDQRRLVLRHQNGRFQVYRKVGKHYIEANGVQHCSADGDDELTQMLREQAVNRTLRSTGGTRCLSVFERTLHRLIRRRILELDVHEIRADAQRTGKDERNAPAPLVHRSFRHDGVHDSRESAANQQADSRGSGNDRAIHTAFVRGRILGQERCRTRIFARSGKALDHTEQKQQSRSANTQGSIPGKQADAERGTGHHEDRNSQRPFAALLVAHVAPEDSANGTKQERQSEHCKCLNQR